MKIPNRLANGQRYRCKRSHTQGVAFIGACWDYKNDPEKGTHVGFVVSTYGGFAPNPWQGLSNGFSSKKSLVKFCQENGFAIYWFSTP